MRPTGRDPRVTTYTLNPTVHNRDLDAGHGQPILQYASWYRTMEKYNKFGLTYPTDKFPALSGIAKSFQKMIQDIYGDQYKDRYVAGLWVNNLPAGLLWRALGAKGSQIYRTKPPLKYVAPSWSWASLMGTEIKFVVNGFRGSGRDLPVIDSFRISAAYCTSEGATDFGQIKDGALKVSGQLCYGLRLDPYDQSKLLFD